MRIVSSVDIPSTKTKLRQSVTSGETETEKAVTPPSRALSTRHDTKFLDVLAMMQAGQNASSAVLAQQIAQRWPSKPDPMAAAEAYRSTALPMLKTPHTLHARA